MDFLDIQAYIGIKLLFLLFLVISFFLIQRKKSPIYFLWLTGIISAAAYFLLINNLQLPFWGLQGDEITLAAMYNTFAQTGWGVDFAYHHLASFYPPACFWLFGFIGMVFNLNGIVLMKLAAFSFFLFFPITLYYFQQSLIKDNHLGEKMPGKIFMFLSPLFIITLLDKDILFGKPYEVLAAAATIFWYIGLYLEIIYKKLNKRKIIIYGIIAGFIFITYYLWLIFAALALLLLSLTRNRARGIKYFSSLFKTMIVALLVASPFLAPLIISYTSYGLESWQTAFFTPSGLDLWLPMFRLSSFNGLIFLFGLAVLIYYRQQIFVKQLLYLLSTAFIWWAMGLLSLLILKAPFQEFRGFYILSPMILAITAAYGVEQIIIHYNLQARKNFYFTTSLIGIIYFASQSIFGVFIDDPIVKLRRVESRKADSALISLVNYLKQDELSSSRLTLQTVPQILAYLPIDHLIYFNQHNNNPAAIFSQRYAYVKSLASAQSPTELEELIRNCPYGKLERLIFFKDDTHYYLYFHLDKLIQGIEETEIKFDQNLFASNFFQKVYDQNGYVIIDVK